MEFIDLRTQYLQHRAAIDAAMAAVLEHGRFIMGPEVQQLEAALAEMVGGGRSCISCANGTDALQIALRALGIGPGDEVITTPFTWISSAEVIALVGATPVFADIDPQTYNLDPAAVAAAITPRTRAIIAVSLFGQMYDVAAIDAIARTHDLAVIEDAAQSLGATRSGVQSCAVGHIATTSFFPAKPLGCYGDGGAIFTPDAALAAKLAAIRTHGGTQRHHHTELGTNSRLDTLQAAVLLAKLPAFREHEIAARERVAARYAELLAEVCTTPAVDPGNTHVFAQYTVRVPERDAVVAQLREQEVPVAVYYPICVHLQPIFAGLGYAAGSFPMAEAASAEVLSLPMHPYLTEADQQRVASALRSAVEAVRA
jgi:UDP-2-acetamido-2-deoxy-ribo-hexuluronate aminotransferase